MELRIVDKPLQDEFTKSEDRNSKYPNDKWCVKESMYREGDGGINQWFKEIERVNPDIVYLYEIKSWKDKIVVGLNEEDWIDDIIYSVRYEFKTLNI